MSNRRRIGLLVAFCVAADLIIATLSEIRPGDVAVGVLIAFAIAQVSILAVWSGLGTQNSLLRFGVGLPAACFVTLTVIGPMHGDSYQIGLMILGVWFVLVAVLSVVRIFGGWRFTFPGIDEVQSQDEIASEKQFRIRQMFSVTTVIATVLALMRMLVGHNDLSVSFIHLFALLGLFIAVGAVIVIWALLCETWFAWWVAAAFFTVVWTAGEVMLFNAITPSGPTEVIVMMNFSQFVALSIGMACLRLAGGRLRRIGEIKTAVEIT